MRFLRALPLFLLCAGILAAEDPKPAVPPAPAVPANPPVLVKPVLRLPLRTTVRKTPVDSPDQAMSDQKALESVGLKAEDPAGLIQYLKSRTLNDVDLSKINSVIARLGADDFEERLKAAKEVERFGPAAVGPLRNAALGDPDYEIKYRASECLKRLEKVSHAAIATAAVRALTVSKPPEAVAALLGFLPVADTAGVADDIRLALIALAERNGKPDPGLMAALTDQMAVRRAAAAVALIEGGDDKKLIRIPEAFPKVKEAISVEKDLETKFQMLYSILTVARDSESVGQLIAVLPDLPRGRLWQAEDFLIQLAGKDAPKAVFGKTRESLEKARGEWSGWWSAAAAKTDLAKFSYTPRIAGKTVLVLIDSRFGGPGAVAELGPDMKERWRIGGLYNPMDAQFQPDGTMVIAEHNSNRITIRDTTGKILATRQIGGNNRVFGNPQQVQILPNGNILVTCRNVICEYKKDKDEVVMQYVRQNYDITAARRLDDGTTLAIIQGGPQHALFLDDKGNEIKDKKLKTGMPFYQAHCEAGGPGRVLLTEINRVAEYDIKENKEVWTKAINQPRSVQRLPNGNTLIVDGGSGRLIEVTADGEEVWAYQHTEGFQVFRGYRR